MESAHVTRLCPSQTSSSLYVLLDPSTALATRAPSWRKCKSGISCASAPFLSSVTPPTAFAGPFLVLSPLHSLSPDGSASPACHPEEGATALKQWQSHFHFLRGNNSPAAGSAVLPPCSKPLGSAPRNGSPEPGQKPQSPRPSHSACYCLLCSPCLWEQAVYVHAWVRACVCMYTVCLRGYPTSSPRHVHVLTTSPWALCSVPYSVKSGLSSRPQAAVGTEPPATIGEEHRGNQPVCSRAGGTERQHLQSLLDNTGLE